MPRLRPLADRQQRALAAARWRKDASSRVAQRRAATLLKASKRAEEGYVRDVVRVMRGVHAGFVRSLDLPAGEAPETRATADGVASSSGRRFDAAKIERPLFQYIAEHVGPAFDKMKREVDRDNREGLSLLGIQPAMVPGLAGTLAHARENNIRLVQKAAGDYAQQVDEVLRDPDNLGLRVEELRDLLVERGKVSVSRAELIARDQTLKTNAAVTAARQKAAGVTSYRWSTSQDERVRPTHAALEGEKFDYDDPPVTNDDGDKNNPGEDFQCRCVALPVIPELEEPEGEEPGVEELPEPADVPEVPDVPEVEPPPPGPPEPEDIIPGYPENPEDIPGYAVPEVEPPPRGPDDVSPPAPSDVTPEPPLLTRDHFSAVARSPNAALELEDVVAGVEHQGVADWLTKNKPDLVIASRDIGKKGVEGQFSWNPTTTTISVNANTVAPDAHNMQRAWGQVWRVTDRGPQLRSASEPTAAAKVRDNFLHELGHHLHLGRRGEELRDVDALVRLAYRRRGLSQRLFRDLKAGRAVNPAISVYATSEPAEYFAESFNAYLAEPAALQAHDPIGYAMVRDAMARLRIQP